MWAILWWKNHQSSTPRKTPAYRTLTIEHKLFSVISGTWSGFVLSTLLVVLGCIRRTTTETDLSVTATHFERTYATGVKVTKEEFASIRLTRAKVCPQWNYTIRPHPKITE